jgi:hypothetical protein
VVGHHHRCDIDLLRESESDNENSLVLSPLCTPPLALPMSMSPMPTSPTPTSPTLTPLLCPRCHCNVSCHRHRHHYRLSGRHRRHQHPRQYHRLRRQCQQLRQNHHRLSRHRRVQNRRLHLLHIELCSSTAGTSAETVECAATSQFISTAISGTRNNFNSTDVD